MNWADFTILGIIVVSVLIGVWRGFIREALSLVGWVLAVWVTLTYSERLEQWLRPQIENHALRMAVAVALLFILTMLLVVLINHLLTTLVNKAMLSMPNRLPGLAFGILRGGLLVTVLVLLAGLTNVPREPWWRQSMLIPYFQDAAIWSRSWLPQEFAKNIRY